MAVSLSLLPPQPVAPFTATPRLVPALKPRSWLFSSKPQPPGAAAAVDTFTEKSGYLFELSATEADSLTEYDISRIASIYRRKPFVLLRRLLQVGTTLGRWFALRYLDSVNDRSVEMFKIRAEELRQILVELGPAYVKVAQAVSSRPDLIPPEYLDELSLLQDKIAPFSTEVAFNTIEKELNLPIDELFAEISPEPIAAASLGQVYQARLCRRGEVVAVKVQRPGVQAAIALDILILRYLAGAIRRARKLNTDLPEMDYRKEANNGIKFRELYGDIPDVSVPEMYVDYTTSKVLTMEWIEGQKLSEVKDLYLIEVGVYCSFNQLLERGFYHADPHPGNLLRTYDGKLAYIDYEDSSAISYLAFGKHTYYNISRFLPPTADKDAVTKALTGVFQNAVARGVRNISFGDLSGNLGTAMYKLKFQIPSYFSLVIRSLAVLEGIAISFNPNYKVLGSTYPWIARKVLSDSSPKLRASLQELLYEDGTFRIDRLESLLAESLRAKTKKALVKKSVKEDDPRLAVKQILSFTLTEKGGFLRDIILDEFAKGLDALGLATMASTPVGSSISFFRMTDEDTVNLQTLRRLLLLLSGIQSDESFSQEVELGSLQSFQLRYLEEALGRLSSVQEMLPTLSVISELPPEMQQRLLSLPGDLAGRIISRATARTIRRIFL
ncbi:hypothetical protein CDL15_Pgr027419 [Punica granatum]|uniref:ABC1 atypical kinase-like domain-containing protein n=1 Tax=Punica granatum TaxID=22663 RepID=A0A218XJX5_PUNGR|nr:hypothetical protein CDL15_Pgr027419 [Punica granatum]